MHSLKGRVALVTGASRGIGAATARALAGAGAHVAVGSRSGDNPGIEGALARSCDVRSLGSLHDMVAATVARFGQLDILVINAGVGAYGSYLDLPIDDLESMIDVNVKGALFAVRAALPELLSHRRQRLRIARHEHDVHPPLRQCPADVGPDAP